MQEKPAPIYLDWNATAPVQAGVAECVAKTMLECVGNPSSVHGFGRQARAVVEGARKGLGKLLNVNPKSVVFCASGTEANMNVLCPNYKGHLISALFVSAIEHPSVISGGRFAPVQIHLIPVLASGVVDVAAFGVMLENWRQTHLDAHFMVSVMAANNETGVIQPVQAIAQMVHELGGLFHVDGAQVVGRVPFDVKDVGADLFTFSAHKFGAPKGVGVCVFVREDVFLSTPLLKGGGQERGARAGTENVPAIAGLGKALEDVDFDAWAQLAILRDAFEAQIEKDYPFIEIVGKNSPRLPNTSCLVVRGFMAETLLMKFDLAGVALSSGSACSSGSLKPSHVLQAMGYNERDAQCGLRMSFGPTNSAQDMVRLGQVFAKIFAK